MEETGTKAPLFTGLRCKLAEKGMQQMLVADTKKGQDRACHVIAAAPISWSIWMSQRKPQSRVKSLD
jgi:hypothetical protein